MHLQRVNGDPPHLNRLDRLFVQKAAAPEQGVLGCRLLLAVGAGRRIPSLLLFF